MSWRVRNLVSGLFVPREQFESSHEAWAWVEAQDRPGDFAPERLELPPEPTPADGPWVGQVER